MSSHITVLLKEAVEALQVQPQAWYVDATVGGGGHTSAILEQGGKVLGFDFDQLAIDQANERFKDKVDSHSVMFVRENFDQLSEVVSQLKETNQIESIQGVLFDFGTSTDQLMAEERGLSFEHETAELDMRMDDRLGVKAADLLKIMSEKQLTQVFQEFGGEHHARKIAKSIVEMRRDDPTQLETVGSLVSLVGKYNQRSGKLHPATRVFQALRIAVNDELNNIERALPQALDVVEPGGRIVTIAFHEGEDRLVKQAFNDWEEQGLGKKLTKKPLKPSEKELADNPRSRSAKLRIFERKS